MGLQITAGDGHVCMDPHDIIDEFVGYYQRLLGVNRDGRHIDIRYLRPWARYIVTAEEASQLVTLVTKDEIKNVFFDIAEHKSLGSDGYAPGFFKAAWPVLYRDTWVVIVTPDVSLFVYYSHGEDLILFCNVDEVTSSIFQRGLQVFASLFGLHANLDINQLIISKSVPGNRELLLQRLSFQEGYLPVRYLGLPLISSKLTLSDCQPLLIKINKCLKGWEGVSLTFADRLQLVKSVIMAFHVYCGSIFILPKRVIREIEKRMRRFLWKGNWELGLKTIPVCFSIIGIHTGASQLFRDVFGSLSRTIIGNWAFFRQQGDGEAAMRSMQLIEDYWDLWSTICGRSTIEENLNTLRGHLIY
ncbi:hypothetical protein Sango_1255200 [Sesamum angolense]|uniref:Reverse transcriptase n=1 Tax=Sesamum angolense TaxID=2727404 RepID=A0AAE1WR89_9LAMI|nr:hypothetical protein Sango_1255200 [Sesamum angolense]